MKILIDARSLGQKPSGIGMYIYNFSKELIKEDDIEIHLVSDVAQSNEMMNLRSLGAKLHCYDKPIKKGFALVQYYRYLQHVIHEVKPDIFWEGNNLVPVKIKNPYGKFVATVHDLFPLTLPQYYGKLYEKYFRYGIKNTIKYVDAFIYNSMETKSEMERLFPEAKQIEHFISYIIVDEVESKRIVDNHAFLYVGNLEKRKGTDLLMEGYRQYLKLGGELDLRMAGKVRESDIEEKLHELIKETPKVAYIGYLSKREKEKEYGSCSAFVFPSKAEGFGMPVVEVMNYNKPIIASNLTIFQELVGDEINYFELKGNREAMAARLAEAMLSYKKPNEAAYQAIVKKYSASQLTGALASYFRKIVE